MIDCDVHNSWSSAEDLLPYLEPFWRDYMQRGELPGPRGAFPHAHRPWLHPEGFVRTDLTGDGNPGAHWDVMQAKLLDRHNLDYTILLGEEAIEVSTLANPHYATALARAYNDYLIHEWLPRDPRLKGSLVIAPQDPEGAAAEIRRIGEHPHIVQVLMSSGSTRPYGDRFYHPIWQAAAEVGLPVAIHLGGQGGLNANPIGCGPTTYFWETHALLCETGMAHVASTIANGVFEKWPRMKLVVIECGVAWVAPILWRLDADYKALRKETPWLKRLPSEYAREHIRFGTQPLEQPAKVEHLWSLLEAMDGKHTLLYCSDYPHWDYDDPAQIKLPPGWKEHVFDLNARSVYTRLPPGNANGVGEQQQATSSPVSG
ncbi:MAG: amidohydrolase family protein [Chloroflexota bacterium]|nr:amidohydrolase family protein [Chloroflexota bacterium]